MGLAVPDIEPLKPRCKLPLYTSRRNLSTSTSVHGGYNHLTSGYLVSTTTPHTNRLLNRRSLLNGNLDLDQKALEYEIKNGQTKRKNAISIPGNFYPNCSSPNLPHTPPCPSNAGRMEVVGWSPSEELQDSDMFQYPPQVEGWTGAEGGGSRYVLANSSIPSAPNPQSSPSPSFCAGPSSHPFPKPSSPRLESATVHQRRLKDPEHVRRPRNAFIIYRCDFTHKYLANGGSERASDMEKRSLSKRAGEAWKNEKPETKRYYKELADEERARHRIDHPDYRFRPKRQKSAGQTIGRRSPKRGASSPSPKRVAGRSSSISSVEHNQVSHNDPLQIRTIIVPASSTTLSQPYPSRQPTPDFFHGYGSATPTSPCSPLSPADDILYMPRPTIAAAPSDSFLPYTTDDSQVSVRSSSLSECGTDD